MEVPLLKGERLWAGQGVALWATNHLDRQILEFEEEAVCEAALAIQGLLTRHALGSSYLERLDSRSLLVRRMDPLPVQVAVEAATGETAVTFQGPDSTPLSPEEAEEVGGLSAKRLEMMEDLAAHAARSLRAHLTLHGVDHLRFTVGFGLTDDGSCLAQVINPLTADLGSTDMTELVNLLGG